MKAKREQPFMANVLLDMAMSLDGFVSGTSGEDHGLHDYFFSPAGPTVEVIEEGFKTTGTIIMGRRAYEAGVTQGGFADDPYQVPTFVITHHVPQSVPKGAESFVFVTEGIESALAQASAVTGDKDIVIGGGANIAQQYLHAGLVDEIQIHLVPILLGEGIRLFDLPGTKSIELERMRVIEGFGVIHLRFRVVS
jgi:dihydrofolate reductase